VLPTPSTSAQAKSIWCSALVEVIAKTVPGTETDGELHSRLDALVTYRGLWDTAEQLGYVTRQEAEVNRTYLDGYIQITQLKLAHAKADSAEMTKVIRAMNSLTDSSKALFDSSAAKITDFCQLTYGSAAPAPPAPSVGATSGTQ
jgi:DNA transposition AAA+ family ATPase